MYEIIPKVRLNHGLYSLYVGSFAPEFNADRAALDIVVGSASDFPSYGRRLQSQKNLVAELMGQCDFVSVHAPLNAETRHLIGTEAFAAAKRGMILINTARGAVVDIDALHDALKDGTVLAAGLDVLPDEPANPQSRLIAAWQRNEPWIRHRLLLTPHSAFYTPESMRDIRAFSARTAARYLRDGRLENCVNRQFLAARG